MARQARQAVIRQTEQERSGEARNAGARQAGRAAGIRRITAGKARQASTAKSTCRKARAATSTQFNSARPPPAFLPKSLASIAGGFRLSLSHNAGFRLAELRQRQARQKPAALGNAAGKRRCLAFNNGVATPFKLQAVPSQHHLEPLEQPNEFFQRQLNIYFTHRDRLRDCG